MAPPSSFLTALVVLSCSSVCSLGCEPPHTHGLPHRRALTLLGHMRTLPAGSCQKDRSDFAFPRDAFDGSRLQKAQALSVLHVTNQKLFQLFCTEGSASAAWNGALLDEFCAGLDQQLTHLEACLTGDVGAGDAPLTNEDSALRDYFQRISLYLQEKKYSPCAWEIVRSEIMRSVYSSTALHRRLRSDK